MGICFYELSYLPKIEFANFCKKESSNHRDEPYLIKIEISKMVKRAHAQYPATTAGQRDAPKLALS